MEKSISHDQVEFSTVNKHEIEKSLPNVHPKYIFSTRFTELLGVPPIREFKNINDIH